MGYGRTGTFQVSDHLGLSSELLSHAGRSVTRSYYRGAAGALLVYDITKYALFTLKHLVITHSPLGDRHSRDYHDGWPTRAPWPVLSSQPSLSAVRVTGKKTGKLNGPRQADGPRKTVRITSHQLYACFHLMLHTPETHASIL